MKLKTQSFILLLSVLSVLGFASCTSSDSPSYFYGPIYEFGNINTMNDNYVIFAIQQRNSSQTAYIKAFEPSLVDPTVYPVGSRVMLVYNITSDITSTGSAETNIQLTDLYKAFTPAITKVPATDCNIGTVQLNLLGDPYRAGRYLNIRALTLTGNYTYTCTADEATLAGGTPHIYIAVTDAAPATPQQQATQSRADDKYSETPISIDLTPIWDNVIGKGFILHLKAGDQGSEKTFTIHPFSN